MIRPMTNPDRLRNFGYLLASVHRMYARLFERHSQELGLTLSQCKVLGFLARNEGASQARIAEGTDIDPMTLTRFLDRMEQDGWIERRVNPDDRRAHCLYLREPARPALNKIQRLSDRTRGEVLAHLGSAEREQFLLLLESTHAALTALTSAPAAAKSTRGTAAR